MTPLGNHFRMLLFSIILTLITVGNFSHAEKPSLTEVKSTDPHTRIIQQCIALMEQSKWQQTLDLLSPLIEKNKDTGLKEHGAKFATTYYYKGLCLLKLAQAKNKLQTKTKEKKQPATTQLFLSAIQSLNQCYAINPPDDPTNTYRVKSLLLRGNAQQSLGKYQLAIDSYQLFLLERNNALDPYSLSDFNINLAICLWKKITPQRVTPEETKQAISLLQESLLYTGRNKPTPRAVLTALLTLTDITTKKPTQYTDLIPSTLQRTRNISPSNLILHTDPSESAQLLPLLGKLILHTAQENLPLASLHLTALIPGIAQHSLELELPSELELSPLEKIAANQAIKDATSETIAIALQARALTFQKSNQSSSLKKAIHLYTILVDRYPNSPHQPENLYNLARLTAQSGDTTTAITRASQLLKDHPQHTLTPPTLSILLNTLYHTQQYLPSLTLAEKTLSNADLSSIDPNTLSLQDSASFIRGASHYYLGNYTSAAPLLTTHQTDYPDSPYQTDAAYLTAAVQNQLLHWDTSIPLLRKFIAEHSKNHSENNSTDPTSIYLPFASYDIAFAQYSQRHIHSAILTLLPFTLDIPFVNNPYDSSQISPSAAILLGNTHLLLRQRDTAAAHYQTAIQLATDTGNTAARDEAYYLLIDLLGKPLWEGLTNHRLKETIPYYLHFLTLENAHKSPYHTQILTSAITALEKANLANPELPANLLSQNLFLHNNTPNTPGIETALKTYLYYLRKDLRREDNPSEKIIRILTEDVKITHSAYHQALLIAAQIESLEHAEARNPEPSLQAQINQLYQELISQYRSQDLDNFTLLKTANHLAKSNNLTEAADYYQTIIDSSSNINKTEARLGLAIQLANSNDPSKKQTARTQLTTILENPFTPPATRATAHYHIIKLLHQNKSWAQIETNALVYLKYPLDVKTHNQEILQLLAKSYDKQSPQKIDSAISTYTHIWVKSLYSIQHSAPAIDRACQLLWDRNNPAARAANGGKSDRQLAYETAYKYIRRTKDHLAQRRESLPASAIQTWEKIKTNATETYLKDPNVKPFFGQP